MCLLSHVKIQLHTCMCPSEHQVQCSEIYFSGCTFCRECCRNHLFTCISSCWADWTSSSTENKKTPCFMTAYSYAYLCSTLSYPSPLHYYIPKESPTLKEKKQSDPAVITLLTVAETRGIWLPFPNYYFGFWWTDAYLKVSTAYWYCIIWSF